MAFKETFLSSITPKLNILGGHAAYSDAIKLSDTFSERQGTVEASSFFLFHTVLKTSKDFYESMRYVMQSITSNSAI